MQLPFRARPVSGELWVIAIFRTVGGEYIQWIEFDEKDAGRLELPLFNGASIFVQHDRQTGSGTLDIAYWVAGYTDNYTEA